MTDHSLERLSAFTTDPEGGNPAGVWIGASLPADSEMLRIAREIGDSETAFLVPGDEPEHWTIRYFSPEIEVDFCGHATIAAAVALGRRHGTGTFRFDTSVGVVPVDVQSTGSHLKATLTSVEPRQGHLEPELLEAVLHAARWTPAQLDTNLAPGLAYAGAWHLVLPVASRAVLSGLDYDFESMRAAMTAHGVTTIQVTWREDETHFHARNPFPVGGIVEDPATGAAAAALGGYLRHHRHVSAPVDIVVTQGEDMGRPSRIDVHIPSGGGIRVGGRAVQLPDAERRDHDSRRRGS